MGRRKRRSRPRFRKNGRGAANGAAGASAGSSPGLSGSDADEGLAPHPRCQPFALSAHAEGLERALAPIEEHFDVIVIDSPPSLGLAMDAALYYGRQRDDEKPGSSGLVIPVEAEDTSAQAYGMLIQQTDSLARDYDIVIEQIGLVVNKFDSRRGYIATSSLEKWKSLGTPPVLAVVPDLKEQREAVRKQRPLLDYAPDCDQSHQMRKIARAVKAV
ncbi:ParA family protein [Streptomyces sp. NPDC002209]|uniref:ParA family protein n=1 Tax=Streptomyces sp. NPDC002209 TaxID=3364638 RepID=UPI0036920722